MFGGGGVREKGVGPDWPAKGKQQKGSPRLGLAEQNCQREKMGEEDIGKRIPQPFGLFEYAQRESYDCL